VVEPLEPRRLLSLGFIVNDPSSLIPAHLGDGTAKTILGTITLTSALDEAQAEGQPVTIHFASSMTITDKGGTFESIPLAAQATIDASGLQVEVDLNLGLLSGSVVKGLTVDDILTIDSGCALTGVTALKISGGDANTITGCTTGPLVGIFVGSGNTITGCSGAITAQNNNTIENCTGGEISVGDGDAITGCMTTGITAGNNNQIKQCTANGPLQLGIKIGSDNTVTGCPTTGPIFAGDQNKIDGGTFTIANLGNDNSVTNNTFNIGASGTPHVDAGNNNTITGNTISGGGEVQLVSDNILQDNPTINGLVSTSGPGNRIVGNTISGGVGISGSSNVIKGNFIKGGGPDISVGNAQGTQIVGNTLVGSKSDGIWILGQSGSNTGDNLVTGNFIGTDAKGDALGNAEWGVLITDSSSGNTIGGTSAADRNVISDNGLDMGGQTGVEIGVGCDSNVVEGNYIGTMPDGEQPLPNSGGGLIVFGSDNTIGTPGAGNLISGNGGAGAVIHGDGDSVQANVIGTDAAGKKALGNAGGGLSVGGDDNTIGAPGAGNLISGNGGTGAAISGDGDSVQANLIGTNAAGTTELGNAGDGLDVSGDNNTIGGTTAGAGNVISASGVTAQVAVAAGTAAAPLSSTAPAGLRIVTGSGDKVWGDFIGTNETGDAPLGNAGAGVIIMPGVSMVTIGGTKKAATRNIISGNGGDGIDIINANSNTVEGNYIGTDVNGNVSSGKANDLANQNGVWINSGSNNIIGAPMSEAPATGKNDGTLPDSASNLIRANTKDGVRITGKAATGNLVSLDVIYGNGHMGIELGSGITTLEPTNTWQAYPILSSVGDANGMTTIQGRLQVTGATAGQIFLIEFYANARVDPSGLSEGQWFMGTATAKYNAALNYAPISASFPIPSVPPAKTEWNNQPVLDHFITASAIDAHGDTSEFSPARDVLRSSVRVNPSDPKNIFAWFVPETNEILGQSLSLTTAETVCGVDHFNWLQLVTPPDPWKLYIVNTAKKGSKPAQVKPSQAWDPVENYPTFRYEFMARGRTTILVPLQGNLSDGFPFYWNETPLAGSPFNLANHTPITAVGQELAFVDAPTVPPSMSGWLSFKTYLVGVPYKGGTPANANQTAYIQWTGLGTGFYWRASVSGIDGKNWGFNPP